MQFVFKFRDMEMNSAEKLQNSFPSSLECDRCSGGAQSFPFEFNSSFLWDLNKVQADLQKFSDSENMSGKNILSWIMDF